MRLPGCAIMGHQEVGGGHDAEPLVQPLHGCIKGVELLVAQRGIVHQAPLPSAEVGGPLVAVPAHKMRLVRSWVWCMAVVRLCGVWWGSMGDAGLTAAGLPGRSSLYAAAAQTVHAQLPGLQQWGWHSAFQQEPQWSSRHPATLSVALQGQRAQLNKPPQPGPEPEAPNLDLYTTAPRTLLTALHSGRCVAFGMEGLSGCGRAWGSRPTRGAQTRCP